MSAAAHVVGKMVQVAGPNLGDSWFQKEIGQALNQLEGAYARLDHAPAMLSARLATGSQPL